MFTFPENYAEEKGWSIRTVKNYQESINHFLDFLKKDEFAKEDILAYKARLQLQCRNNTIRLQLSGVNAYCVFIGKRDIADSLSTIKYKKEIPRIVESKITPEIYSAVRDYLREKRRDRDALILDLLYWAGPRISEVLSLRLNSFDFEKKRIRFAQTKTGQLHEAQLTDEIRDSLDLYKKNKEIEVELFKGLTRQAVDVMLRRLWHKCGFAAQSAHKFRHNRITEWGRRYPLQLVQVQSGHKSLETLNRYIHLTLDDVANYDASRHALQPAAV